ncbi:MAG: YesL family protein [Roseburia sp.]
MNWSFDNKFFTSLNKLVDMFLLTLLWAISSIPVFTIGASSTAMYYTVNKVLKRETGYLWKEFWGAFKRNFKQATVIWLLFLALALWMVADFFILRQFALEGYEWGKLYGVFFVLLILEVIVWMYVYPNIARFENTSRQIVKNAALMAVIHLPQTLIMVVALVALALLVYAWPVTILIVPTIYVGIKNLLLEKIFRRYMSSEDLAREEEKDREVR